MIQNDVKKYFQFKIIHKDKYSNARVGEIITPHGRVRTPVFMPVGTHGAIKALPPDMLEREGISIILANTYHLHLSPGSSLVGKSGGLHAFMGWKRIILTDSGGFQVFSLQKKSIDENGASFKDKWGGTVTMSPEISIEVQQNLGSDIMMAFDECIPWPADRIYVKNSIERTHRWLKRCLDSWSNPRQALFGIIQGSVYKDLRKTCVEEVTSLNLPGNAIGGVSVGEGTELMEEVVAGTAPLMPVEKPRYVMGVGVPEELLILWEHGIDMSDCIIPTKFARGGTLFTNRGKIRIRHRSYRRDFFPVEPNLDNYVNKNFTRAYLKHLFDSNEILGQVLATEHNIAFYNHLALRAQEAILEDRFLSFKKSFLDEYGIGRIR